MHFEKVRVCCRSCSGLFLTLFISSFAVAGAQTCSPAATEAAKRLHAAQLKALAFEAASIDSGVPPSVAPLLIDLKSALAEAADAELSCATTAETAAALQVRLNAYLREAAPGLPVLNEPEVHDDKAIDDDFKPVKGQFGNEVKASVREVSGPPRLLEVTITSSVTCGDDSQLLIYQPTDRHWTRVLRWSADFGKGGGFNSSWIASEDSAWGDFFLTGILTPDKGHPEEWRAVVAHGTPWCTSRLSGFGLAVLAPSTNGHARIIWQTHRSYSRFGFDPKLRASGDTFELRLHADEMSFNEQGFERLVVYHYRLSGDKVIRIEPVAAHARGFVEEWLEMPWEEALAQSDPSQSGKLQRIHKEYEANYRNTDAYTSWSSGPVQACAKPEHFQVTMTTDRNRVIPGKHGGESIPGPTYYFQLTQDDGYRLLDITSAPDVTCHGPNLMEKP